MIVPLLPEPLLSRLNVAVPLQQKYGSIPLMWRVQGVAFVLTAPFAVPTLDDVEFTWSAFAAMLALGTLGTALARELNALLTAEFEARRALLGAGGALLATPALAQAPWPNRPIRLLVPFGPGGSTDVLARLLTEQMAPRLGQPFVSENRTGAGGAIGSEVAARAPADGYNIYAATIGTLTINEHLYARLPYDPDRDFTGVGFIGRFPLFIVVRPNDPVRDFAPVSIVGANLGQFQVTGDECTGVELGTEAEAFGNFEAVA